MRRYRLIHQIALLCTLLLCATQSWSHAKTDLITVANGDQITGAVNAMTAGKLSVSTSYAGTINIKWRDVKQIESRYLYEVRLDDGERIYGRFTANDIENKFSLRVAGSERQFDTDDIVEVRSIEEELADKLDLQVSTQFDVDPNSKKLVFYAAGTYDVRGGRTNFSARVNDTKNTVDEVTETSNASWLQISREFWRERGTAQSYRVLNARYDTNDELGIAHRGSVGVGLGRYLINDLGHELAVSGGIQGVQERRPDCEEQKRVRNMAPFVEATLDDGGDQSDKRALKKCYDAELFLNLKWHLYSFQRLDMDISLIGNTYPSLSDWGRIRGDLNLLISWELFDSFYWTVNAQTEIDNAGDREDESLSNSDYTLSTGITWKY
tara:strand:- start:118 stop:1260 length:1143 start_codon:yes stop_codon:yes gene_type:complete